ncbi:MAG: hypothetical protein ACE5FI_16015, partial [Anaerolineales bacterium]
MNTILGTTRRWPLWLLPFLSLILAGCLPEEIPDGSGLRAWIDAPLDGAALPLEPVIVESHASDDAGVQEFALYVNGELERMDINPDPTARLAAMSQLWSPTAPGDYTLEVRARNAAGAEGRSTPVRVRVGEFAETETPTPAAGPEHPELQCALAQLVAPELVAPADGAEVATPVLLTWRYADETCTPHSFRVDISEDASFADIRWGFGTLDHRETSREWPLPGGSCYYWRALAYSGADDAYGPPSATWRFCVPAGEATPTATLQQPSITDTPTATLQQPLTDTPTATLQPSPTFTHTATLQPSPTFTHTPTFTSTPTATPIPPAQVSFTADSTSLVARQCTTLHWSVQNATAVYLNGQGVVGQSSQQVCPGQTTIYSLHVEAPAGNVDQSITINVTQPPTDTP